MRDLPLSARGWTPFSYMCSWSWYQGGTLLSSGSLTGTTKSTTVQPAAAGTAVLRLTQPAGKEACGVSQTDSFSAGSHINFLVRLHEQPNAYHFGCFDSFSMKS